MTTRLLAFALAVSALSGCTAAEQIVRDAAGAAGVVQTTAASWTTDASEFRGRAGTYAFDCPPNPSRTPDTVWGSGPYTDDSSVCWAGVHAGAITADRGGRVLVQPRAGQNRYVGSTRNGVETIDYASWDGSFAVVR